MLFWATAIQHTHRGDFSDSIFHKHKRASLKRKAAEKNVEKRDIIRLQKRREMAEWCRALVHANLHLVRSPYKRTITSARCPPNSLPFSQRCLTLCALSFSLCLSCIMYFIYTPSTQQLTSNHGHLLHLLLHRFPFNNNKSEELEREREEKKSACE